MGAATTWCREERMNKPRIFLGSSGKQEKLLQALTRGLEDVAHVDPWVRLLRETMSSSKPASSVESSECAEPSSSMRDYWKGERPRDPKAPQLNGTGEIRMESADRAAGYFTTRADTRPKVNARTAGVYWRADPEDMSILDGGDDRQRAELIAERLTHWKSITNT
jgi:hypothetical protein